MTDEIRDHNDPEEVSRWLNAKDLVERDDFVEHLQQNHPREAAVIQQHGMDRRTFLKLMGASMTLAGLGLSGCGVPARPAGEQIIPYVRMPEELVPGKPLFFASAVTLGGYAKGLLIETHEGRPTRVEGNSQNPASLGGADVMTQASLLELYNPDRSTNLRENQEIRTWDDFMAVLPDVLASVAANNGAGLRILTETITSPTLADQLDKLLQQYPQAMWYQYEPVSQDNVYNGAELAFGEAVETVYQFENADVILSLDGDFLTRSPGSLRYARDFAEKRRVLAGGDATMSRLYAVESTPSNTGAMADHLLTLRASQIELFARALAAELGVSGVDAPADVPWDSTFFDALVEDLQASSGSSLIFVGAEQSPAVHALAHAINAALNNVGETIVYLPPVVAKPTNQTAELGELVSEMQAGDVETLFIMGGNPVFNAPADVDFEAALANVGFSLHLALYNNETSANCSWHIPETHYIEAWSDARTFEGSACIMQPPIGALYENVRSAHEIVALLMEDERSGYEILREFWESELSGDFETAWRKALHDGVIADSAPDAVTPSLNSGFAAELTDSAVEGLELIFRPDPNIWDGRYATNAWLQELPRPLTRLTWDNAALISPATAESLGLASDDLVELGFAGNTMTAPVLIQKGHPDDAVTINLGFGHGLSADLDEGQVFDAYTIRPSGSMWFGGGLEINPTGDQYELATVREHDQIESEHPVRTGTLAAFNEDPGGIFADAKYSPPFPSLLENFNYDDNSWGMSIDLTSCIGCNACIIGCQMENNIPTVGKASIKRSREMFWIRVDNYVDAENDDRTYFQPVPCMHCETAPCEVVCPVEATVHGAEGLNQMVYNRCIGTRYCSANCPYSVRRFNYLKYVDEDPINQEWRNPDVTVRVEGVMEKCSYCIQRINAARITANNENRPIADGEVVPACAGACPTQAISFGNLNDADAAVVERKSQPHDYGLLAELNTVPRTTYLARLYNPNDALNGSSEEE